MSKKNKRGRITINPKLHYFVEVHGSKLDNNERVIKLTTSYCITIIPLNSYNKNNEETINNQ